MKGSNGYMLLAYLLIFIGQFFEFGYSSRTMTLKGEVFDLTNTFKLGANGWHYHPWYIVIPVTLLVFFFFYKGSPKWVFYWIAAIFGFILSLGSGWGAYIALAGSVAAFYAVYLKRKEQKGIKMNPGSTQVIQ